MDVYLSILISCQQRTGDTLPRPSNDWQQYEKSGLISIDGCCETVESGLIGARYLIKSPAALKISSVWFAILGVEKSRFIYMQRKTVFAPAQLQGAQYRVNCTWKIQPYKRTVFSAVDGTHGAPTHLPHFKLLSLIILAKASFTIFGFC